MSGSVRGVVPIFVLSIVSLAAPSLLDAYGYDENDKPILDPFKILVVRKTKATKKVYRPTPRRKGPPPIPPLVLKVTAVAGEAPDYVAVIQYKGKDYIVEKGFKPPDKNFLVRTIYQDKIEVFYSKDKTIKSFYF